MNDHLFQASKPNGIFPEIERPIIETFFMIPSLLNGIECMSHFLPRYDSSECKRFVNAGQKSDLGQWHYMKINMGHLTSMAEGHFDS